MNRIARGAVTRAMVRAVLALVAAYLLGVVSVHAEEVPALGTRGLLAKLGVQLRLQPPFTRAGVEGAWEAGSQGADKEARAREARSHGADKSGRAREAGGRGADQARCR